MVKSILAFLLLIPAYASSQINSEEFLNRYNFQGITINDGLLDNYIDDIYKDKRGFLWLATSSGLSRYDGYGFVHYNTSSDAVKLKSNFIKKVCEDNHNRLWIASEGGIDIIDLSLNKKIELSKTAKFAYNDCSLLLNDSQGNMWVGTNKNIFKIIFSKSGEIAEVLSLNSTILRDNRNVKTIGEVDREIWIGYGSGLYRVENGKSSLELKPIAPALLFDPQCQIHCFLQKERDVWIGTDRGLIRYNINKKSHRVYYNDPLDRRSINQSFITALAVTGSGELVVATLKGINFYFSQDDNFISVTQRDESFKSGLTNNFVNSLLCDDDILWIGTEIGGVNKMIPRDLILQSYRHSKDDPKSISANPINSIYEDTDGNLWVGNMEGGLNMKRKNTDSFIHFKYSLQNPNSLSHNSVSAITEDNNHSLWIGTWGVGVNKLNLSNVDRDPVFTKYEIGNTPSLKSNFIGSLCFDPLNNGVWVGTLKGLNFIDINTNEVEDIKFSIDTLGHNSIVGMTIDRKMRLWVGMFKGLLIIDLHSFSKSRSNFDSRFLGTKLDNPQSEYVEKINCIMEDSRGTIWLGSHGYGLYKLVSDKNNKYDFVSYTVKNGLPNDNVLGILEDDNQNIWISTNHGISCFNPRAETFRNFSDNDGILSNQFYWNAYHKSASTRTLYFGNTAGLIGVEGIHDVVRNDSTRVVLTRLNVLNNTIHQGGNGFIKEDISQAEEIRLHEKDKSFSIEFSALDFRNAQNTKYAYRLQGFDNRWTETDALARVASYTNLNPGDYKFQVRATSGVDGRQSEITEIDIHISPYFYKTTLFRIMIALVVIISVVMFYLQRVSALERQKRILTQKVKNRTKELEVKTEELYSQNNVLTEQYKQILEQKEQLILMSQEIQEVTSDKLAFFTNITHEFRTPITLIIGPIARALKLSGNAEVIEQLELIERNSKSLLSLVNQLLDFRKVDSNIIEINLQSGDLKRIIQQIVAPFRAFAEERNISIITYFRLDHIFFCYDQESLRKVVVNLLSNAIKFTPSDGCIKIYVANFKSENHHQDQVYICISDTGIGIPEWELTRIFDRFYQSKEHVKFPVYGQSGTGIGLYLCKNIVEQNAGLIYAKKNHRIGTSFRALILMAKSESNEAEDMVSEYSLSDSYSGTENNEVSAESMPTILVVEDNRDMVTYIRSILYKRYRVLEAENGEVGLKVLIQNPGVDFIISDLMMPVMDGIEFSRRVKDNILTSHIPLLILTAKSTQLNQIESYRIGVDEYLTKPFDEELLLVRIENILRSKSQQQKQFRLTMDLSQLPIEDQTKDKKFMDKAMSVIEQYYTDPEFEVTRFAHEMGVSKTLLNNKLQMLTGQPTGRFIRTYRLTISHKLIIHNNITRNLNVSQIAYQVGFNDPKYFSRCFFDQFGVLPSTLLEGRSDS